MLLRVGRLVEPLQVFEDVVLAADRLAVVRDEHGDLVRADVPAHLLAVIGVGGDLPRPEVEPELGQPPANLVRVRAPFRLVELHECGFPSRPFTQTG
jgi:hypothetical protein